MSESIAPVSWGVISTADIGMRKVIPAMQQGTLSRVDAIASRDPATASSIFLTTATDVISMGLLLGLAALLIR